MQCRIGSGFGVELAKSHMEIEATRALTRSGHGGSQKAHGPISACDSAISPAQAARSHRYVPQPASEGFGDADARSAGVDVIILGAIEGRCHRW